MYLYHDLRNESTILSSYKSRELVPLKCSFCSNIYHKNKHRINSDLYKSINNFCSMKCLKQARQKIKERLCKNCDKKFLPTSVGVHNKGLFCSKSCSATYNNKHRKHGTRRSKLEIFLEEKLTVIYPNLEIHFNRKDAIGSELDIYIPSLKLAFELNGIFHYEPIHGKDKLNQIQNNDENKFQTCQRKDISLCIIDTSSQKYVKESTSQKFLKIIMKLINECLVESG